MNDHCIHEADWGVMQKTVAHLEKEIDGNGTPGLGKTVPVLTKSVNDLIIAVGDLRTAVSGLVKFQEGMVGAEKQRSRSYSNTLKTIGVIIAFSSLLIAFITLNRKTTRDVRQMIDEYGFEVVTRSCNDSIQ